MPTLAELRAQLGPDAASISDEQLYAAATQAFAPMYSDPRHLREELVGKTGQWGNRFGAAIDSYQANLYGLGEAVGSTWAGQRRKENEDASNLARRVARDQGAITSYKDVGGVGDALNYVGGLAVDSSPYLLEAALGGLAGRAVAGGARLGLQLGKDLGMPAATKAASTSLGRASTAGAVAASYPSAVGDILSNQREESGGQMDLGAAAALGVPYAALNAFGLEGAAARATAFRNGVRALDNVNGVRGGLTRAGATAAGMGLQEGASETGQEFLNQAGRNAVNPKAGYFGPEAVDRYLESFVGGAALGGVMGGAGGWRRSEHYKPQTPPADPTPGASTDLLNTPPPQLGWNGYHNPGQGQTPFHVFPDGSTATTGDMELMQRYGMTPGELGGFRAGGDRFDASTGRPVSMADVAGPAPGAPAAPQFDPRFAGFGNVDPTAVGLSPFHDQALTPNPAGGERVGPVAAPVWDSRTQSYTYDTTGGKRLTGQFDPTQGFPHDIALPDMPGVITADQFGAASGNADALYGRDNGDPGLALARQRYAERLAQQNQIKQTAAAVQEKAQRDREDVARAATLVGGRPDAKIGDKAVGLVLQLEEQRDAGLIDEATFVSDVAALSNQKYGQVAKAVKERDSARNAAGTGGAGAADVGRGAGSGVAPAQPGNVQPAGQQPAAQAVLRPGADGVQPGVAGRGDALTTPAPAAPPAKLGNASAQSVEALLNKGRDESRPKRTLTAGELALVDKINKMTPRNQSIIRDLLGLDAEGNQVNKPLTYVEVGAKYTNEAGKNKGQTMTRAGINAMLKVLGINQQMVDAAHASYAEAVDSAEITSSDDEGGASVDGYRIGTAAETAGEAKIGSVGSSIDETPEGRSLKKRAAEAAKAFGVDEKLATTPSTEVVDTSTARGAEQELRNKQRAVQNLVEWLDHPDNREDVLMSGVDWDDARSENEPAYADLSKFLKAMWARDYLAQIRETQNEWGPIQQAFDEFVANRREQLAPRQAGVTGRVEGEGGRPGRVEPADGRVSAAVPRLAGPDKARLNQSGDTAGRVLRQGETRKESAAWLRGQPAFAHALERLDKLGLGHVLNWISEIRDIGSSDREVADGWIEARGNQYVMSIKEASAHGSDTNANWTLRHELGHAADLAVSQGVYSAHPDIQFVERSGRVVGDGPVAQELAELHANGGFWGAVLDYPLGDFYQGAVEAEAVASEVYAQLFAVYTTSEAARARMEYEAPLAFRFVEDSINDIRQNRPLKVRTPGEVAARRTAFANRYRGAGEESGQPAALRRDGSSQRRGGALGSAQTSVARSQRTSAAELVDARPGANVARMAKLLGPKLYGSPADLAVVSVKEIFQNSFDAVKSAIERGSITKGKINIKVDKNAREIHVVDNGAGMTPSVLANQFLQIAGTSKDTSRASGGLGIAKMLFLYGNESLHVMTARDGKVATLDTSGEQLMAALDGKARTPQVLVEPLASVKDAVALFPDGHGTAILLKVPETYVDPSTGEEREIKMPEWSGQYPVLGNSPLFDDIDVTFDSGYKKQLPIGSLFPAHDFTQLANVKFDWGTAHIYITKDALKDAPWGENLHVLSNGLWQFSTSVKVGAGWDAKNAKRTFYLDVSPRVSPEETGYPFDLNRQQFSKTVEPDMTKIMRYLGVMFRGDAFKDEVLNFGAFQYMDSNGPGHLEVSEEHEVKPSFSQAGAIAQISPGDDVRVKDGKLVINNRAVPDLTEKDLEHAKVDIDSMLVDQGMIDPTRGMLHDNVVVPRAGAMSVDEARAAWDAARAVADDVFGDPKATADEIDAADAAEVAAKNAYRKLRDNGPSQDDVEPLMQAARDKFGKRADEYVHYIGQAFMELRHAVVESMGDSYAGLLQEAIGVSFDKEYRGVSIKAPFSGMFINPAVPEFTEPDMAAYGMYGTMVHELAHYKVRSHDASFPAEMQRILMHLARLQRSGVYDAAGLQEALVQHVEQYHDVMMFLNEKVTNDGSKPRGRRFKDGAYQTRAGSTAADVADDGAPTGGRRGVSGGASARPASGATRGNAGSGPGGGSAGGPVRYSRGSGAAAQAVESLSDLRQAINDTMPSAARDRVTNLRDAWAKYSPYLLSNFQLMEKFGDKLKSLKDHLRLTDLMTQEATRQQMQYDEVAKRWVALPEAAKTLLHDIMQRATLNRIHPDKALTDKDNAHLTAEQKAEYPRLRQDWERLSRTWPAATKVYTDALAVEDRAWQARADALEALTKRYGIAYAAPKRTPGPYFPLARFGDYLAVAKSKEFLELEDQILSVEKDDPVTRREANKILDEMRADPKHYQVSAHETRAAADRALAGYRQQGYEKVYSAMKDQHLNALPKNMHATIAQLAAGLSKDFAPEQVGEMTKVLGQVMLQSLPEARAVMEDAARKGVAGASPDMLRAFAAKGRTDAFATSRLLYAKDLAANMQAMKAEAQEGGYDLQHVHREIEKRVALNMQFHDTPIQNAVNSVSWAYHLGMSPAFLFMNMTQPWLVSGPVLAGRFGLAKATAALGKASREAIAVLKDARFKDGKWDAWAGIHEGSVPEGRMMRNAEGKMVSEDRKALRELMLRDVVNEGLNHEMSAFSSGYSKMEQARKVMGWASQQVELVNRTATALAAFRLARDGGMDYNDAVEYAYRTSVQTQIDYSAEGAPRFMRSGGGIPMAKMMFQFRRYQQAMAMLLLGNLKKAAPWNSGEEAKVARATLGYFGITTLMTAGVMGLPGFTAAAFLLGLGDDDDDERGDLKTRLRNYIADMTGDKALADALAKGLPTLMGADLSGRIGMGDVFSLYPRLDLSTARSVDEKMGRVAAAVMGPGVGGLGAQAFRAGQFFEQGDWAKGTEQLVPKMAADVIQAGRVATKGMTDMKGEQILGADEISAWDTTLRALGVSPQDQANYYEANAAVNKVKRATADRKAQIHNQYRAALQDGNMSDVRALIAKFNEDHPQSPIKPKDELAWRKDARKQESLRGPTGLKLDPKRDRQYQDLVRFAQ